MVVCPALPRSISFFFGLLPATYEATQSAVDQWFSTFSVNGTKSRLTALLQGRLEILPQVNRHVLLYCRTKYVTQNIRDFIRRLPRAA